MKLKEHKLNQLELLLRQTEFVPLSRLQAGLANWEGSSRSKDQLSPRQVFRYIQVLEDQRGVQVEQRRATELTREPAYRIYSPTMIDSPGLTDDQFEQLMALMGGGRADEELMAKLLHILSGTRAASFYFRDKAILLERALKQRVKVLVGQYYGRDRNESALLLDPVRYDGANGRLYAMRSHKPEDPVNKYNLELMEDIRLTDEPATPFFGFDPNQVEHDPFGFMPRGERFDISLLMRPFAYSQLFRQFPHLMIFVEKLELPAGAYPYRLQLTVYDIQPVARFVTGLLDEVKIEGDERTRGAIKQYIEKRVLGGVQENGIEVDWISLKFPLL
ncbi:MAG: WYL domain-containing protein [Bacteroidetes bacterium]|nr:WYL domain-containing protein [Bacteroidota bacterium]